MEVREGKALLPIAGVEEEHGEAELREANQGAHFVEASRAILFNVVIWQSFQDGYILREVDDDRRDILFAIDTQNPFDDHDIDTIDIRCMFLDRVHSQD